MARGLNKIPNNLVLKCIYLWWGQLGFSWWDHQNTQNELLVLLSTHGGITIAIHAKTQDLLMHIGINWFYSCLATCYSWWEPPELLIV